MVPITNISLTEPFEMANFALSIYLLVEKLKSLADISFYLLKFVVPVL